MTKYLIFDSGSLINITQNGLIEIFLELEKIFQGEFLITPSVKYETIEHPMKIKKFEWGAIRINQLLEEGIIKMPDEIIDLKELDKKTSEVLEKANNALYGWNKPIHLIERGEAEAIALSLIFSQKGIDSGVVIDERTARMMCESLNKLKELMSSKLHTQITIKDTLKEFSKIKIFRSTEIMYLAFKSGISKDKKALEAILYALKYGGCSISEKEINSMKSG